MRLERAAAVKISAEAPLRVRILSTGWLKVDSNLDPLRKNPTFQKLVAGLWGARRSTSLTAMGSMDSKPAETHTFPKEFAYGCDDGSDGPDPA